MSIEVETALSVVIRLSEEEARAVLVDAAPFQKQLRAALGLAHGAALRVDVSARKNGHKLPNARKGKPDRVACPQCGKTYKRAGLVVHMNKVHLHIPLPHLSTP